MIKELNKLIKVNQKNQLVVNHYKKLLEKEQKALANKKK